MRTRYFYGEKTVFGEKTAILLKYYILDKEFDAETGCEQWGIEIESYSGENFTSERVNYLCEDYERVTKIIKLLIENEVTTVGFYEVMQEIV